MKHRPNPTNQDVQPANENQGDLRKLRERTGMNGAFQARIHRDYRGTDEAAYTCRKCRRVFQSNQPLPPHVDALECG